MSKAKDIAKRDVEDAERRLHSAVAASNRELNEHKFLMKLHEAGVRNATRRHRDAVTALARAKGR